MIEPTDEMVRAFREVDTCDDMCAQGLHDRLAAVLAIVERDYDVSRKRCGAAHPDENVLGYCGLPADHEGDHLDPTAVASVTW
jgi:hypothetical protein